MKQIKYLKQGIISLEGNIANEGIGQYIKNGIIPKPEEKAGYLSIMISKKR